MTLAERQLEMLRRMRLRVHRLAFQIDGKEAPAVYRFRLPEDTFGYPPVELDGKTIRIASPLALYQIRIGIAGQGSFGELSERQQASARRLRDEFLADVPENELEPRVEPLT
jgi:hypothetical protein